MYLTQQRLEGYFEKGEELHKGRSLLERPGGWGTSLLHSLKRFFAGLLYKTLGDAKTREALLSSWSAAWEWAQGAPHGLSGPDKTPKGMWVAGPGRPWRSHPKEELQAGLQKLNGCILPTPPSLA